MGGCCELGVTFVLGLSLLAGVSKDIWAAFMEGG
jgi:hypothetical protein